MAGDTWVPERPRNTQYQDPPAYAPPPQPRAPIIVPLQPVPGDPRFSGVYGGDVPYGPAPEPRRREERPPLTAETGIPILRSY
jgi:hypothetical protein